MNSLRFAAGWRRGRGREQGDDPTRLVRWSPSVTLVPTRSCFNACAYCGFRREPSATNDLSLAAAERSLRQRPASTEVLLLSGEVAPGSPERARWLARLLAFSGLALALGRLPHTNAGPLSRREMAALARLNPSLGLMLEGLGPAYERLHRAAPSKRLALRLGQLEQAGRLGVPFTTGLLLGVGESRSDRLRALELLAELQRQWGHLQEVILQPWRPDGAGARPLSTAEQHDLLELIEAARRILPAQVALQLPPNLWPLESLPLALEAGINDLGGIDSHDVINAAYPQPSPRELAARLERAGWSLRPRLCVHDRFIPWLPPDLRRRSTALQSQLLASGLA
ncbi:7,8-didemethyl-8-hydroxy-5-deazariboflavin synthase subunit CofG [Synechococcus sp. CS-1329]|uniref:7,8-didemethyl-8-hydroxy-5-deazariboflavin synthase subunit CofG n=1 Tax=Synechococcus sp. CS-1329 TaxID=2847975 RepID=UPI00223BB208|nr:7,8-didemethyl-8-hydroxy-5-deazariboflavin synthase subunit CofG [Synechococcus sp. CS-1329]MCT0217532.1 7,8-didemethyl-8-hydroxy-5-deazariboflavin synthase subunit CofG [Synechococcus sp. CS-1329]